MTGLRNKNPNLKALAAIGGWNEGSTTYSAMVGSASCRATFIASVIKFMDTYGFDGFDLDWEYPAQRGSAAADKNNFSTLLAEMRAAFGTKYMLTAAVASAAASVDLSYDVPKLSQYVPTYILGICENIAQGGWTVVWDDEQQVPYAYKGNQWVGFDNAKSMTLKTEYAKYYGLGGVMVWSLETDDFNGKCGEKDALLKAIKRTLGEPGTTTEGTTQGSTEGTPQGSTEGTTQSSTEGTTQGSTEGTTQGSTEGTTQGSTEGTTTEGSGDICRAAGYARDPATCTIFYQCVAYRGSYIAYPFTCPAGLYFDLSTNVCNWPSLVPECKK
ncbi:chitinase [Holotrichia oblita]|uniref:Chitinase n=1 Tax=Holotrichia oblita TaxID=644536 RepID=A0ACB9TNJ5_HOLOL|nr:chitinase [Holotrichia oblita]